MALVKSGLAGFVVSLEVIIVKAVLVSTAAERLVIQEKRSILAIIRAHPSGNHGVRYCHILGRSPS